MIRALRAGWRALLCAALCTAPGTASADEPPIGPTPIPFYTGNLSVDTFMHYWGTSKAPPVPQVTPQSIAQLRRISCFAVCDYMSWATTEQRPGVWDFSLYKANADALHRAGFQYNIFAWVHFAPKWFASDTEFVPYRCLEHNLPMTQLSLWAPSTRRRYEAFYRQLAKAMGPDIDFVRLAMPSEYGELGYPVGMTNWLVPQPHVHPGYWCGDPTAREAFQRSALARYRTVPAVNRAWGTGFRAAADIAPPAVTDAAAARVPANRAARRRWLDFQNWYDGSQDEFMTWLADVVRHELPAIGRRHAGGDIRNRREIIASLGYGSEAPASGNDQGRHVAAMQRAGVSAQTPGDIGYFATRRVSSACAFYGVPYYTEPPGDVPPDREVQRIWMDASNGAQVFFDYPNNLDGARALVRNYKRHLTGHRSAARLALLLPSTTQSLHPEWGWPPRLAALGEAVRARVDYEVVDEAMAAGGALDRFGASVLAVVDAEFLRPETMRAIGAWVRRGGTVAVLQSNAPLTPDGSPSLWHEMVPALPDGGTADSTRALWRNFRIIGRGAIGLLPSAGGLPAQAPLLADLAEEIGALLPGAVSAPRLNPGLHDVSATLFRDRMLYYNAGAAPAEGTVAFRPTDFPGAAPRNREEHLVLPPHSITSIELVPKPGRAGGHP